MRAGDAAGARLVLGESDDTEPNTANNLSPSPPHPALATLLALSSCHTLEFGRELR